MTGKAKTDREKVVLGISYQQIPPSSGILPFLSLQPASSSAPVFIFPVMRAGGWERGTFKWSAFLLALVLSLRLSSLPDFSTVSGGEAGASVIQCRALRCRRLNVNHTGNLGNRWARPPANADWSTDGEPEVTSPRRSTDGTPRAVLGSCTEPNKQ